MFLRRPKSTIGSFFFGCLPFALITGACAAPLRVATFNVEWGLGSPGGADFESAATVLNRIGGDVVALQELMSDAGNLQTLGTRLGLPHSAYQSSTSMRVGLLSRYPISQTNWIFQGEMERPILLARIDVPDVVRDPWVAVVHLKCCNTNPWNQYTRAAELYYLRKEIDQRTGTNDPVMIMGDFNLVAPTDVTYGTGPEGVSPFPAPASADGYFIPQGIFKLDARHAGLGGETWTWRSNGEFPSGALDHIMVNAAVRARGTAVEVYNAEKDAQGIAGLPKQGAPLPSSFAYISDHLPVFADIRLDSAVPVLSVTASSLANFSTFVGQPSTSQSLVISGSSLLSNTTITAPAGYAVSLTLNSGYASSVTVTPVSGTITPTAIYVRLTGGAAGTITGSLQVTSSGITPFNIPLSGTAFEWTALTVDSSQGLDAEGPITGPFTPTSGTYVLRNNGSQPLNWTAESDAAWVSLSASSGTLASGASATIAASLNGNAASLPFGLHQTSLRFVNRTDGSGTTTATASVFVGSFVMDGVADAPGYTVSAAGITLSVAVRGTKLYVATRVPPMAFDAEDHHILITDALLPGATAAAPWSKRGLIAADTTKPYLAAEGGNSWSGWFNAPVDALLQRSPTEVGVLEGAIDLVGQFGAMPEFIHIAVVAYETRNAITWDASAGRVVGQVPLAVVLDDDITPDEFLKIPVRSITDSAGEGRFDVLVPGRGFAAQIVPGSGGQSPELRWPAVPWRDYTVLRKPNLTSPVWQPVYSTKAGAHTWELSMPDTYGAERGFYKVEATEPGF